MNTPQMYEMKIYINVISRYLKFILIFAVYKCLKCFLKYLHNNASLYAILYYSLYNLSTTTEG